METGNEKKKITEVKALFNAIISSGILVCIVFTILLILYIDKEPLISFVSTIIVVCSGMITIIFCYFSPKKIN